MKLETKTQLTPRAAAIWKFKGLLSGRARPKRGPTELLPGGQLSRQLRYGSERFLAQRRAIVGLSLAAIGAMGLISLYQMGILRHLPAPPWPGLDSDRVDASPEAYERFSTPDAVLGLGSYAMTMALAEMGGTDRARKQPWIPLALAGKVLFDVAQALRMIREQWTREKAFCFWCLVSAAATFSTAALHYGEAREAARTAFGRTRRQQ